MPNLFDVAATRADQVVMGLFGRPLEDDVAGAHVG